MAELPAVPPPLSPRPLRVLMLTDDVFQWDRRILQEAESLLQRGAAVGLPVGEVALFGLSPALPTPSKLPAGARCIAWPADPATTRGIGLRERIWRAGSRLGLRRVLEWATYRFRDPAGGIVRLHAGRPELAGFDVVVAHALPVLPLALALHERCGSRVVFDAHEVFDAQWDSLRTEAARRYWRTVGDRDVAKAHATMTVTPQVAGALAARHRLAVTPAVVFNACPFVEQPSARGRLRALYAIPDAPRLVLCQGGLLPHRGLEELCAAGRFLDAARVRIVFLGHGEPAYVRRLAAGAADCVHLGRSVTQDELLAHTVDADLGVITDRGPGINNTLGGPNRLFEYLQARVPVLSHEHEGVRAVLAAAGTGWVERWRGPRELAERIGQCLDRAPSIDRAARDRAARQFSWEAQEPALFATLRRALRA
ncbi:MAG: glycosyltransferase [Planctomycetota bacterium]